MESFAQCLTAVKDFCRESESETIYNIWLKGLEPVSFEGDVATLSVSSDFIKSMVEDRYLDLIKHGFLDVMGFDVTVKIESRSLAAEEPKSAPKT